MLHPSPSLLQARTISALTQRIFRATSFSPRASSIPANESALVPEGDASSGQVVGRDLESYAIAGKNSNAESPHLPRDRGVHVVAVVHLHTERRIGEYFRDGSFQLGCFFFFPHRADVFC